MLGSTITPVLCKPAEALQGSPQLGQLLVAGHTCVVRPAASAHAG
jgi:hypothetical protein